MLPESQKYGDTRVHADFQPFFERRKDSILWQTVQYFTVKLSVKVLPLEAQA